MKDIKCPYCGNEMDICHDDGYGYKEDETYTDFCGSCNKSFVYRTSISFYYDVEKADCLNDGNHDFKPTKTFPKFMTKMRCTMCDKERQPLPDEMIEYAIPTYEEYLKETELINTKETVEQ